MVEDPCKNLEGVLKGGVFFVLLGVNFHLCNYSTLSFTFNIPFFLNLIKENMGNPLVLGFFQHFPVHFLAGQDSNIITL